MFCMTSCCGIKFCVLQVPKYGYVGMTKRITLRLFTRLLD